MSKIFGGRYEVIEKIGAGGMAIVYKAKDLLLARIITIKVLREQFVTDEEFVERFRREAKAAASLSHPNIVSIYDVGDKDETKYIVMEYVKGQNLKEIIRNHAPLAADQSLHLIRQIAEAISHAHDHHIIHRDIKPHNVLVTADGGAKVTDFGIARAATATTVTSIGDIVGSVHYLSPEQARGIKSNEQSDIYSLGITLYELVTGQVPYDGETPITIALKHLQEDPISPSKLNPKVSPALEALIMRAIAKDPEQRYPTAQAFLQDLDKIQADQPTLKPDNFYAGNTEATKIYEAINREMLPEDETNRYSLTPTVIRFSGSNLPAQPTNTKSKHKLLIGLGVTIAVLLVCGGVFLWAHNNVNSAEVVVPSLTGKTITEATALLNQSHLHLAQNVQHEDTDNVAKGLIIQQDPTEKTMAKEGREVQVWVSDGPAKPTMPNLKNQNPPLNKDNVESMIQGAGFTSKPTFIYIPSATVPSGSVVDQSPAPNTPWPSNGDIEVTLSSGPQTIPMPNVLEMSSEAANARLISTPYNFVVIINTQSSKTYPRDVVMSTNPNPGDAVQEGATVMILVSLGPEPWATKPDNTLPKSHPHKKGPN